MTPTPNGPPEDGSELSFPETEEALAVLAASALPAAVRARHLHAIRARAAELGAPVPTGAGRRGVLALGWRSRWRRGAAIAGVWLGSLSLGTGVAAAAAMNDLPGDPLYGLKRAVEAVQLFLPADSAGDVHRRLALAQRRLDEAALLHDRRSDDALIAAALDDADALLSQAGSRAADDPSLHAAVAGAAAQAQQRLTKLLDETLPEQASPRAREALEAARERMRERQRQEDSERRRLRDSDARPAPSRDSDSASPSPQATGEDDDDGSDNDRSNGQSEERRRDRGRQDSADPSADPSAGDERGAERRGVRDRIRDNDDDEPSSSQGGRSPGSQDSGSPPGESDEVDDDDDDPDTPSSNRGRSLRPRERLRGD